MNLKESRISFLLLFSLSLLLLAFIILFAWGFIYYRNAAATAKSQPTVVYSDSSAIAANRLKDSLQRMYSNTVTQLNNQLDIASTNADSIKENIDIKYREFSLIRNEIAELLDQSKTVEQVNNARQKLVALQQRLDDWRQKYSDVAAENVRLSTLLKQLTAGSTGSGNMAIPAVQRESSIQENAESKRQPTTPAMQVAALQLQAVDDDEQVKLSGSMNVTNNIQANPLVEMYVVILQPDGKLVKQSAWNSGSFETNEGTRIYSCKLRFDCPKGENKSLSFSVPSTQFQKGKYNILVYHNGVMVAKGIKQLS